MKNGTHNYKELIELAVLDAFGLLEPIETDLFNRSFHDAPASIQDEIIQMQREFALDESLLPASKPPVSLKQQVLQSVAKAADKEAQRLAPLALIGARASAARGSSASSTPKYFWRTAALILFGVCVVLGIIAVDTQRRVTSITQIAMDNDVTTTLFEGTGKEFRSYIDNPYCTITRLERETGNNDGYLRVAINERIGGGYVIGLDLEEGEEIIIQGVTTDGQILELARITVDSPITGSSFEIAKEFAPGLKIQAVDANTGNRWI